MKHKGWLLALLVVVGVVFVYRSCQQRAGAPEERLVGHLDAMCDIARGGVEQPEPGVRRLGRYVGKHLDDIFGSVGGTLAAIERIEDDRAHDDRARLARDRLARPLRACERDWSRFFDAVESDPEAAELLMRAIERLNRTLEIILSSKQRLDAKRLPAQLEALFGAQLR